MTESRRRHDRSQETFHSTPPLHLYILSHPTRFFSFFQADGGGLGFHIAAPYFPGNSILIPYFF